MKKAPLLLALYLILLFVTFTSKQAKGAQLHTPTLSSHASMSEIEIDLADEQWQWLQTQQSIRVGVTTPDNPPFDMTMDGNSDYYEGLSADYLQLLSDLLKVRIELRLFNSKEDAILAIKAGELDLLTGASDYEASQGLLLSQAYVDNQAALYTSEKLPSEKVPTHIAMVYDYLPDVDLTTLLPKIQITPYPSKIKTVAAAVFGEADAVIMDLFSANYIVNNYFAKKLRIKKLLPVDTQGISFAISPNKQQLKEIIDDALKQIPQSEHWAIKKRWSGGGLNLSQQKLGLDLTETELIWLKRHQPIRIAANKFNAPMTYFDKEGRLHGFAADILEIIRLYSGIDTVIMQTQNFHEITKSLQDNSADLALLSPSDKRKKELIFTKELAYSPFVWISLKNSHINQQKDNFKIALPTAHISTEMLPEVLPEIKVLEVSNYMEALEATLKGKVDATIAPLIVADYYVNHYYDHKLEILGIFDSLPPATAAFATSRGNPELISILNKILAIIPADELQSIGNRWRSNAVPGQETWRDYKYTIYSITIAAILLITASLIWAWFTRSHYLKRLRVKKELQKQLIFMQEVIDSIPHPIYVRNTERNLILCNQSYLQFFQVSKQELINRTVLKNGDRIKDVHTIDQKYIQAIDENRAFYEDRRIYLDEKPIDVYHWFRPYKNEQNQTQGIVGGWIDVSDRIELMRQLSLAKELAEKASVAKTQFLATMSHEIRTPMNAIIGLLELSMKRSQENLYDFKSIRVAYDSAKGLLELIGDILDIVRIEAGQLSLNPVQTELKQTLDSVIRIFEGIASQKGLQLLLDLDPKLPTYALLDPLRIKQILSNLIGNSIKFTEQGNIVLTALKAKNAAGQNELVFKVADTGIGMPIEEQQDLFNPFVQAHNGAHNKGGTGLGLPICRSLCEMMGGSITLVSEPGQGTCINIRIPLQIADADTAEETQTSSVPDALPATQAQHVLIVDDHPANRLLLSQQLKYMGHSIDEANDGQEALQLFNQHPYRIVITDCNMPEMDGYELSRKLRQLEKSRNLSPAVILGYTANAQLEVKKTCLAAGMNDCLFKPISLSELKSTLDSFHQVLEQDVPKPSFLPSTLDKLTDGNLMLTEQLLHELLNANEADLISLKSALKAGDEDKTKSIAHKIKGAAKIISATSVVKHCEQLEQAETLEEASVYLVTLSNSLEHLAGDIRAYLSSEKKRQVDFAT
ncbi:ATP-binding protein [Shewanella indica]|uniref:ATP-binding protein n=1 Tax=Shewanella indica TaxID=768528 RepID=UPI001CFDB603|nr:transporter substrate-binding domain-containing protein [Shewanella indica]